MKNKFAFFIIAIFFLSQCGNLQNKDQRRLEIVTPTIGNIEIKVLSTGTVTPYRRIEIKSSERGRVEKIYYDEGNYVRQGETLALVSTIERISLIDTARANLFKAKKSGDKKLIQEAKEELKIAEHAYNPVPIIAPVSGEIIKRSIEVGEYIEPTKVLFVISDRLVLRVLVDEADIGKIKINQKVKFYLDAFPDEIYYGKVARIAKEGELISNVMQYEVVVFPNKVSKKWISGMTVNAEFYIKEKKNVLLLPVEAVKEWKNKKFVVILENGKQILKRVKTGISDYKNIEIIKGIKKDDKVVILNDYQFLSLFKKGIHPGRMKRLIK